MIRFMLILVLGLGLGADARAQVKLLLEWGQDSIVIGSETDLIISAQVDPDDEILVIPTFFIDTIYSQLQSIMQATDTVNIPPVKADYEVISLNGWEDKNDDGLFDKSEMIWSESNVAGLKMLEHRFRVRLWDPGENMAIYPPILIDKNGVQIQHNTPPPNVAYIKVIPPLGMPASSDSLEMAPIRSIIEEESNITDYLPYLIGIGIIGLVALSIWYISKRKLQKDEVLIEHAPVPIFIPAHIKALEKFESLKSKNLWQQGKIKEYQSELTFILRSYLEDRFNIDALEKTTKEIKNDLHHAQLSEVHVQKMTNVLQVADLVKFAKAVPGEELHTSFLNDAIEFVNETKLENETEEG